MPVLKLDLHAIRAITNKLLMSLIPIRDDGVLVWSHGFLDGH